MTKKEIRKMIENKIRQVGVKKAYKYFVIENAKVIKPQMKSLTTEKDKAVLVNLAHSITVGGFKDSGMLNRFSSLFYAENVIHDNVWDFVFEDLIKIVDKN